MEEVAKVAVGGAIETAGTIGNTAVKAVKDMLVGVVEGVKEVASAALPKPRQAATPEAAPPSTPEIVESPEITTKGRMRRGE